MWGAAGREPGAGLAGSPGATTPGNIPPAACPGARHDQGGRQPRGSQILARPFLGGLTHSSVSPLNSLSARGRSSRSLLLWGAGSTPTYRCDVTEQAQTPRTPFCHQLVGQSLCLRHPKIHDGLWLLRDVGAEGETCTYWSQEPNPPP